MIIHLLIASSDSRYSEHLSDTLSARYADTFEAGVCSTVGSLADMLSAKKYDAVLVEPEWAQSIDERSVKLKLAFWSEHSPFPESAENTEKIQKYQRISTLVSDILEHYAGVASGYGDLNKDGGKIISVWSPAGGVGKTTVALAYATREAASERVAVYLDLEHFSSTNAFFSCEGKSISSLFEKLETNAGVMAKSLRQHDSGSGVDYFNPPNNFDDINELTSEDYAAIASICASISDIVVIDLPSVCDKRVQSVLELSDIVLLVSDGSKTTAVKYDIFFSQHSIFGDIRHKSSFVLNKGAKQGGGGFDKVVSLPLVKSNDPVSIYKTLSGSSLW